MDGQTDRTTKVLESLNIRYGNSLNNHVFISRKSIEHTFRIAKHRFLFEMDVYWYLTSTENQIDDLRPNELDYLKINNQ